MTHGPDDEVPIFDYAVVSEGGPTEPKQGQHWEETAYRATSADGMDHEHESLGRIELHAKGPQGSPRFDAKMTWEGHDIDVEGPVPGGDRWRGKGKAKAKGPRPDKEIPIEFTNPKRWG